MSFINEEEIEEKKSILKSTKKLSVYDYLLFILYVFFLDKSV